MLFKLLSGSNADHEMLVTLVVVTGTLKLVLQIIFGGIVSVARNIINRRGQ